MNQIQKQDNKSPHLQVSLAQQSFSGPLPHPEILKMYNDIMPGSAEKIIKMAEDQSLHRRNLENKVIESDVKRQRNGQVLGFIISMFGLLMSAVIAIFSDPLAGAIVGFGTLASLVGVFMYGINIKAKNLKNNE
jgi:uncharacterized membrane protein